MKAPRVTLDQWRTLQAVVDHGGFAQAAEVLHRSQSSVSYTVARMQDQLGVPLLRIDGRKAVLTEAGEVLLREAHTEQAMEIGRRICDGAAELFIPGGEADAWYTVSVGVASACWQDDSFDSLLNRADKALYVAKQTGRNRVVGDNTMMKPEGVLW